MCEIYLPLSRSGSRNAIKKHEVDIFWKARYNCANSWVGSGRGEIGGIALHNESELMQEAGEFRIGNESGGGSV